jgi:hypothetical protein
MFAYVPPSQRAEQRLPNRPTRKSCLPDTVTVRGASAFRARPFAHSRRRNVVQLTGSSVSSQPNARAPCSPIAYRATSSPERVADDAQIRDVMLLSGYGLLDFGSIPS